MVTEAAIGNVVDTFYVKVRADGLLGPVFEKIVQDWPAHLQKMKAFWSTVILETATYKGNPMIAHVRQRESIDPVMFDRWLALWRASAEEVLAPEAAAVFADTAARIADTLKLGLWYHLDPNNYATP